MKPLLLPRLQLPGNDAATAVIDDLLHKVESLSDWKVGGLVRKDGTPGTRNYRVDSDGRLFAKLSGTTSPYTATPVYPTASGAWTAYPTGSLSGVYEANGVGGLNGKVVRVWPTTDGNWRFIYSRFGSSGGGPPEIIIPYCPCSESPVTLTMTSSEPFSNLHMFQDATLVYGACPSGLLALGIGPDCYLSTTTFPDYTGAGYPFYYYLFCYSGYYMLTRVFVTSTYGSPYRDMARYLWPIGLYGNTCTPFSLPFGIMYTGGDSTCVISISG